MPPKILLIRHGETEWNRVDRFRGRSDIDLNEVGMRQAEATASRLSASGLSEIYCSPLKRAVRTAEVIARVAGAHTCLLPDLIDVDYGRWQGLTMAEAQHHDPELFAHWKHRPQLVRFPQGESMEQARIRVTSTMNAVKPAHPDGNIVIITHVVVCRLLVLHFLGAETTHFWNIAHDNCGITTFTMRGDLPVAIGINDTCHLRRQE